MERSMRQATSRRDSSLVIQYKRKVLSMASGHSRASEQGPAAGSRFEGRSRLAQSRTRRCRRPRKACSPTHSPCPAELARRAAQVVGAQKTSEIPMIQSESSESTRVAAHRPMSISRLTLAASKIRTCNSLDAVAEGILRNGYVDEDDADEDDVQIDDDFAANPSVEGERELARKMGGLRLENSSVRFIGGTSHLIYLGDPTNVPNDPESNDYPLDEEPITSWSKVTKDTQLLIHLINIYFNWHYPYFTTLHKSLFYRDLFTGKPLGQPRSTVYCYVSGAFAHAGDSRTKGDHFFAEAKKLIIESDECEKPKLTAVQALALMSVREAGCGREAKGWVYSGMSFRMAQDIGLNLDIGGLGKEKDSLNEQEIDARRITFWGCFLFDKCWSNYLGRLPQLPRNTYNVPKYDVFPDEDSETWSPYTDSGFDQTFQTQSRTRAAGLQLSKLCEISSDLLLFFYHPNHIGRSSGKTVELKKLSELHRRLEDWKKELPKEFEPKEGQLPNVILTQYHLQYIHLFRPFLKYTPAASPLPAHVSPRRICTANACAISKLIS
ncbi:fungal-specific transcription factor domain-containing protein [Podospora didyma]|uniref:Fungal-specific transcription factor domain-containing protein n=1 Tax=Podospora didyma TaxID=330526 RepID=A0AAE0N0P0_9PEZI|nr:fungal-specific transcription factor domain-containing protein [Podospora didyma]